MNLYEYKVEIVRVIDGDTVVLDIDLGCGVWLKGEHCRLYGINAPEKRRPTYALGIEAKTHLCELLDKYKDDPGIYIRTHKDKRGKYGRFIIELMVDPSIGDTFSLNQIMIKDGHAIAYMER